MNYWWFLVSNCGVAIVVAGLIFLLTAYFSLPVRSFSQGRRVVYRMLVGLFRKGKQVVFVKEGQLIWTDGDKKNAAHKLALVDSTSAIVLGRKSPDKSAQKKSKLIFWKPKAKATKLPMEVPRTELVVVGKDQAIRGVASLRSQVRLAPSVRCRTSDGIEFTTSVSVMFSVIQPPQVLKVGYIGEKKEDLREFEIDSQTREIKILLDEFEEQDKAQVNDFRLLQGNAASPSTQLAQQKPYQDYPPYSIDDAVNKRIINAAYYHPLNVYDKTRDDWMDLPLAEAIRIFRNLLERVTYDELFVAVQTYKHPLAESFKPSVSRMVRNQGLISYQLISRVDGAPLKSGQKFDEINYWISPVQEFGLNTSLRERGIKIIYAGFSELDPGEVVRRQRLENWQAHWQRKVEIERANQELELTRLKNRARANAQRAMVLQLSQILQSTSHSEEALTMRIFQALEKAATDPATQRLMPGDAIALLRSLRLWLLPGEQPSDD